jgi:hypothetical protein
MLPVFKLALDLTLCTDLDFSSVDGQYQYQAETKRQRTAYTRHQALELEKVFFLLLTNSF